MDPIANIKRQRELAQHVLAAEDEGTQLEPGFVAELAELVLALDEWRLKGGFDPYTGIGKKHIVVVSWKSPDSDAWVFGTYDHPPTEEEMKHVRQVFMEETTTSEMDWMEFGCEIRPSMLIEGV